MAGNTRNSALIELTFKSEKRRAISVFLLSAFLAFPLEFSFPALAASEPTPELDSAAKLSLSQVELSGRMLETSRRSLELNGQFTEHIRQLLTAAETYDVETYRKADDELSEIIQLLEANYLEYKMLLEVAPQEWKQLPETTRFIEINKTAMQQTRMQVYKSSAIFYLCFGLPVQSAHYGRLSLSLAEANAAPSSELADILFYAAAGLFWSSDYSAAESQLKKALSLKSDHRFASYYLGDVLLAERKTEEAIETLLAGRQRATTDEARGNLDRALALAYTLEKKPSMARQYIDLARKELADPASKEYKAVDMESLGVVSALAGDYALAEKQLSDALPQQQLPPVKMGNRLEAAQTALWRSYCREKLGNLVGAGQDRKYALTISDESTHLSNLARLLDPIFGHKEEILPIGEVTERWAVAVGISKFADPHVPQLRYPAKDATDIRDFLISDAGFKPDHVRVLLNADATRAAINDAIAGPWLAAVKPGDLVFLFISSHGTPAYQEIGAFNSLVTFDTQLDHLFTTSLPLQSIVRLIRSKLRRQHVFVVLDTCYSGGLGAPGNEAKASANVDPELMIISNYQLLVSSSNSKQRSWESKRYPNSVFSRQFINLVEKYPRYDDFRSVFLEIAQKVNEEVAADFKNTQTPTLAGRWSGRGLIKDKSSSRKGN